MLAEAIIGLSITLFVALIMIGLGVSQLKSKTPVGFYTGEKPPEPGQLSNVAAWNKKHGTMWITYGIVIILFYAVPLFGVGMDSVWFSVLYGTGYILPIPVMMWYHSRLVKTYKLPEKNRHKI